MIASGRYDREFIRDWSNGPFLVRDDTNRFLDASDVDGDGRPGRYVVWDRASARAVVYEASAGRFAEPVTEPLLEGGVCVATRTGVVACRPAFERYAALCRDYPPERVARITGVTAAQILETARLLWERRPVAYFHWTGLEQHTNASQTVRAISLLYALTGSSRCCCHGTRLDRRTGGSFDAEALAHQHRSTGNRRIDVPITSAELSGDIPGHVGVDGRSVRSGSHGMAGYSPPTSTAPSWTARPTVFSAWSASVATCWCPRPARRPPAPRLHGLTSSCGPICF